MELISYMDSSAANFIDSARTPFWDGFFIAITYLGEWWIVASFLIIISVFFMAKKRARYDLILWPVFCGSAITAFAIKYLAHRQRPPMAMIQETSSSFPSAHAVISVAFYGFVAYLIFRNAKSASAKILIFAVAFVLITLLGFSRLYLGVHYLSDVIAGYLFGLAWFGLGFYALKKYKF